jgi:hypothetical protein
MVIMLMNNEIRRNKMEKTQLKNKILNNEILPIFNIFTSSMFIVLTITEFTTLGKVNDTMLLYIILALLIINNK